MTLNGKMKNNAARPPATILGTQYDTVVYDILDTYSICDQDNAPTAKKIGPRLIICLIAVLMRSVPGTGRLIRFNNEYFCIQYIINIPKIAKMLIKGCKVTKYEVKRYKLMKYMYSQPVQNYMNYWLLLNSICSDGALTGGSCGSRMLLLSRSGSMDR